MRRLIGRWLYLSLVNKKTPTSPKIFFQISKKMAPRAVDRNLLKRRLRSLLNTYQGVLKSDQALVIGLKVKIPPLPTQADLKQDLNKL
ncbi:MAG: ribonuclease P protein component [bacterium]|nr:ribonuclease P protein component [bacterium]